MTRRQSVIVQKLEEKSRKKSKNREKTAKTIKVFIDDVGSFFLPSFFSFFNAFTIQPSSRSNSSVLSTLSFFFLSNFPSFQCFLFSLNVWLCSLSLCFSFLVAFFISLSPAFNSCLFSFPLTLMHTLSLSISYFFFQLDWFQIS